MSVMTKTRACLLAALWACASAAGGLNSGCAAFGSPRPSTVAQGKYYASGNPYYDDFFVDLYLLQVGIADAAKTPEVERAALTHLLELEAPATPAMIEQRLHEEALKLSKTGVRLRLDVRTAGDTPEAASAVVRSNARPKEAPTASLLAAIETSSTNLLRWSLNLKQGEEALNRLELMTIRLDADVDRAFAQARFGKLAEVKENLADAHKLIPLMRARGRQLRADTEQLLSAVSKGIATDDGSIGPPIGVATAPGEPQHEPGRPPDAFKRAAAKLPKGKPSAAGPRPKAAAPAAALEGDAPAKPRAPSKPAPARDFEP